MSEDINVTDGTVLEALNNKVDLDGGNYVGSPLEEYIHEHCMGESTRWDGQWVSKSLQLASNVTYPKNSDLTYDLTEYLPDDGAKYEIILSGLCNTSSSSALISVQLKTDAISTINVCACSGSIGQGTGSVQIPIKTARSIIVVANSKYSGTFTLTARAYRRIGTNP